MNLKKDLFPIFRKSNIEFIDSHKEMGNIISFNFKSQEGVDWGAGQHGIFTITHKKIKKATRPFSVASASSEGIVKITTHMDENNLSDYKAALKDLKPGMTIRMQGPVGGFYLKNNKPTLMIALGLGITPYRSMLIDIEEQLKTIDSSQPYEVIKLLYYNKSGNFIFKDEFDELSEKINCDIHYLEDYSNLKNEVKSFVEEYGNHGQYCVVGSSKILKEIIQYLRSNGVSKKSIIKDTFLGY